MNVGRAHSYGRYLFELVGRPIGHIEITSDGTESGQDPPTTRNGAVDRRAVRAAVALAVKQHNAGVLAEMDISCGIPIMSKGLQCGLAVLASGI